MRSARSSKLTPLDRSVLERLVLSFLIVWSVPLGLGLLWPAGFQWGDAFACLLAAGYFVRRALQIVKSLSLP